MTELESKKQAMADARKHLYGTVACYEDSLLTTIAVLRHIADQMPAICDCMACGLHRSLITQSADMVFAELGISNGKSELELTALIDQRKAMISAPVTM